MRRCWFGLGVLVLILVLGLLSGWYFSKICTAAGEALILAAESEAPEELIAQAARRWQDHRLLAAVLCNHTALDSIQDHFALLDPNGADFREHCLLLAAKFQALGQSQKLTWENLL